jgi:hypothetical protein
VAGTSRGGVEEDRRRGLPIEARDEQLVQRWALILPREDRRPRAREIFAHFVDSGAKIGSHASAPPPRPPSAPLRRLAPPTRRLEPPSAEKPPKGLVEAMGLAQRLVAPRRLAEPCFLVSHVKHC